ncbi:MAG: hypothetical protein ACKVQC_03760 [Elusimicrobiota bacterium]
MGRIILIVSQLASTVLFMYNYQKNLQNHFFSWVFPLCILILIIVNSVWFSRFVSWSIFSGGFFGFLVVLSAFTIRWRLQPGFDSTPFYRSIIMYVLFIYISLAQLKILGHATSIWKKPEEKELAG